MMYAGVRISGHGVIGPEITISSIADAGGGIAELTTGAVPWTGLEWATVLVRGSDIIAPGRYAIRAATATTLQIAAQVDPLGSTPGTVALDDEYTLCTSIPPGVGSVARTRWHEVITADGIDASIGATIDVAGGISAADGGRVAVLYRQIPAVTDLLRHVPTPAATADDDPLRLAASVDRATTTITTGQGVDLALASAAGLTAAVPLVVDGESIGVAATPGVGIVTVARGVLGSVATGHARGAPVYVGLGSAVGRSLTLTVWDDPAHPDDVVVRTAGQVVGCELADGATRVELSYSTELVTPVVTIPAGDAPQAQYVGIRGGKPIALLAQQDPTSVASWLLFGSVCVRVRRAPAQDQDADDLGVALVAYELPPGFTAAGFRVRADIGMDDAVRLYGPLSIIPDGRVFADGSGRTQNDLPADLVDALGRSEVARGNSWWTRRDGTFRPGQGLYEAYAPRLCHVIEPPGTHAAAIDDALFLAITPSIASGDRGVSRVEPVTAVTQVLTSTGTGANGALDLLPAEFGAAVPPSMISGVLNPTGADTAQDVILVAEPGATLGDLLTRALLRPAALIVTQDAAGSLAIRSLATPTLNTQAAVTDTSLVVEGDGVPRIDGPSIDVASAIRQITAIVRSPRDAERIALPDREVRVVYSSGVGIVAGGALYGRVMPRALEVQVETPDDPDVYGRTAQLDDLVRYYGQARHRITIPVRGPAADLSPGAVCAVSLTQIPGLDGTRGFAGQGIVIERRWDRFSGLVRLTLLLTPLDGQGRAWAPGGDVTAVVDATDFTLGTGAHVDNPFGGGLFIPGDRVHILTANLTLRSTVAPGVVATWDDDTGAMTLSVAASDGSPVTPAPGDIVTLSARADQSTQTQDRWAWVSGSLITRWQ